MYFITNILHRNKRKKVSFFKALWHLSSNRNIFFKLYRICLSVYYHLECFSRFDLLAINFSWITILMECIFSSFELIGNQVLLVNTISKSLSNCQEYSNVNIIRFGFNQLEDDLCFTWERNCVKRRHLIIVSEYISLAKPDYVSFFNFKAVSIFSEWKMVKRELIESISVYSGFLVFIIFIIICKLVIIGVFIFVIIWRFWVLGLFLLNVIFLFFCLIRFL